MKVFSLSIIFVLVSLMPNLVKGQQSIKDAFNEIINCKKAEIESSHSLERDMETGIKIGQCDIYDFELPKGNKALLDQVLAAFEKDGQKAFSIQSGKRTDAQRKVILAVGDGKGNNATLIPPGENYTYACFLAPKEEDPDGNYRYAYGISYDDVDPEDDEISGRLVITYAETMKRRQDSSSVISVKDLANPEIWDNNSNRNQRQDCTNPSTYTQNNEPWIRVFIKYVTALGYSNAATRATNAGYLYEVTSYIHKYKNVTEQDKETARGILRSLIDNPSNSDPVVNRLLKSALDNIN